MPTAAQFTANRQNARLSTGPRTEEGKARCSQNAVKHGVLAQVRPEHVEGWDQHLLDLYRSFKPQTGAQRDLVEHLALLFVRLKRIYLAQEQAFDALTEVAPTAQTLADRTPDKIDAHLMTLHRYETGVTRQIARVIQTLKDLDSSPMYQIPDRRSPFLPEDQPQPKPSHRKPASTRPESHPEPEEMDAGPDQRSVSNHLNARTPERPSSVPFGDPDLDQLARDYFGMSYDDLQTLAESHLAACSTRPGIGSVSQDGIKDEIGSVLQNDTPGEIGSVSQDEAEDAEDAIGSVWQNPDSGS